MLTVTPAIWQVLAQARLWIANRYYLKKFSSFFHFLLDF